MTEAAIQPPPRLLTTVDLNRPLRELEAAILEWACRQDEGAVFSTDQLEQLRRRVSGRAGGERDRHISMDLQVAIGALQAREKEAPGGWEAYIASWEEHRLTTDLGMSTEIDQLRDLQDRFGGILLNSRAAPFVLLIPCSDGTWVQMGWTTLTRLASSPLDPTKPPAVISTYRADEPQPAYG